MALNASPVSRNLHLKVTFLNLELEDLLAIMFAVAVSMLLGNLLFPDRYVFHIPLNYFIPLMILVAGVPGLMIFKYGKPRHYLVDLLIFARQAAGIQRHGPRAPNQHTVPEGGSLDATNEEAARENLGGASAL